MSTSSSATVIPSGGAAPNFTPGDSLAATQWHLFRLGDLARIWDEFTGAGVHVGIYDDGVQYTHHDLNANYDPTRHVVIGATTFDGDNVLGIDGHGTAVAGLIAAENDGNGTVGVAFGASLTGVNIFDTASALDINAAVPTGFYNAIAQSNRYDVVNNSWGSEPGFLAFQNIDVAGSFAALTLAGWASASAIGRGGLGTIVVKSAGNDERDAQGDGLNASRYTITVAAIGDSGFAASYSNHGASILVGAPGSEFESNGGLGILTTDLLGTDGYNLRSDSLASADYTDDFGGTSAAGPIVAAVVALMLDANAGLGWRDVQNILAASATHTGSAIGATSLTGTFENGFWYFNEADNWNGGGMHAHANYGYGHLNAYNAVRMAEVWTLFAPAQNSANEVSASTGTVPSGAAIPDLTQISVSVALATDFEIEHVALTVTFTHANFIDLDLYLISAEGTTVRLLDGSAGSTTASAGGLTWTFGIETLRGETSAGTWTVVFDDVVGGSSGTLTSVAVTAYGRAASVNDVFHFTDEFAAVAALPGEGGRRVISDTDGGTDWVNAAAVSTASTINLNENAYSSIDGSFVRIVGTNAIENAIGGDGRDVLTGNAARNELRGMRGADLLIGGVGNDTLVGGADNDTLTGGADADSMVGGLGDDLYNVADAGDVVNENGGGGVDTVAATLDWTLSTGVEVLQLLGSATSGTGNGSDNRLLGNGLNNTLSGGGGNDTLRGEAGNDNLNGGTNADSMAGGAGNDTYIVDDLGDVVTEMLSGGDDGGVDEVRSTLSFTLGSFLERLALLGTSGTSGTGNTLDNSITGNGAANTLSGGDGADTLDGGIGADTLLGGGGNDVLIVNEAGDVVTEGANAGIDLVLSSVAFTLGLNIENLTLTGNGAVAGTGNGAANRITGNNGANALTGGNENDTLVGAGGDDVLNGGAGADSLVGGLGNDRYTVDSAGDVTLELLGEGNDSVVSTVSWTLGANVESLQFTGTAGLTGTGNDLVNRITGNNGGNLLQGMGGNDVLAGLDGADTLQGGAGADQLTGGTGADRFFFAALADGVDRIVDFVSGTDFIVAATAFGGGLAAGALAASRFVSHGSASATSAFGVGQFIYHDVLGALFYDADGGGGAGAVRFATLSGAPSLAVTDILIA
jgi:Ca2+-binding RTX toxin-like protein